LPYVFGSWFHSKMQLCDWQDIEETSDKLMRAVKSGERVISPFSMLAIPCSPDQQQQCARIFARDKFPASSTPAWRGERYQHDRIRLGYFSGDFRDHPVAQVIAELLERHDRSRFEIVGYSFGQDTQDPWRRRLESSFDQLLDVAGKTDQEIAGLAREMEIDITVDLMGFTQRSRMGVFALRPSPIQVSYLGYPGTSGTEYIDYIMADAMVIPAEHRTYYTEQVVWLPGSYFPTDSTKAVSERHISRAELGLPEDGFVFCCFNNSYKITPDIFEIWMRLLKKVAGSVLWLSIRDATAIRNLRTQAQMRGVSPERLVFAGRMELSDHFARHRQADLFLDTFYYNAHTTASDALWAGLPVLTCLGNTFAGRVAASLLNAVGLPELITYSHQEYESLALQLATDRQRLMSLRDKLARNRGTQPLFDTVRFTKHVETAYTAMWQRQQAGLPPHHICVEN
jgi:predicted O-linked N-acetylglucosamine transferase (SPINDLY family)